MLDDFIYTDWNIWHGSEQCRGRKLSLTLSPSSLQRQSHSVICCLWPFFCTKLEGLQLKPSLVPVWFELPYSLMIIFVSMRFILISLQRRIERSFSLPTLKGVKFSTPFRRVLKNWRICMFFHKICSFSIKTDRFVCYSRYSLARNPTRKLSTENHASKCKINHNSLHI